MLICFLHNKKLYYILLIKKLPINFVKQTLGRLSVGNQIVFV